MFLIYNKNMSNNISNKKVQNTHELKRDLEVEPICGNFSYINFDKSTSFQRPQNTYQKKEDIILTNQVLNHQENIRRLTLTGETKRMPLNYGNYIPNGYKSAGRGFGDFDISQELRYGTDTRQAKKTAASTDLTNFKIGDNYFSNYNLSGDVIPAPEIIHLVNGKTNVVPWARGGIDTRNLDKYRKN